MLTAISTPVSLGQGTAVLAFDVGGTDMKAGLVDESGSVLDVVRVPTPHRDQETPKLLLHEIVRLATRLTATHGLVPAAAGLLVPGHVDEEAGMAIYSENLDWHNVPFRALAREALAMPVAFGHDVRGAGLAEYELGAANSFQNVLVMVIGTGISSAVFIGGSLYSAGGMAGETGHSIVADGPECVCGSSGCLEAVASAAAIARRYNALTGERLPGAKEVLERAELGDTTAEQVWQSALDALALDVSHSIAVLAPDAIVIGGGLAQAGAALFEPVQERLDAMIKYHRMPVILPASLGEDAGLLGAALIARKLAESEAVVAR